MSLCVGRAGAGTCQGNGPEVGKSFDDFEGQKEPMCRDHSCHLKSLAFILKAMGSHWRVSHKKAQDII